MKKQLLKISALSIVALFFARTTFCSPPDSLKVQEIYKIAKDVKIKLDGVADEAAWKAAKEILVERDYATEKATLTKAAWKAMYNDTAIYVVVYVTEDVLKTKVQNKTYNDWETDKPEVYFDVNATTKDKGGPQPDGMGSSGLGVKGHYQAAPVANSDGSGDSIKMIRKGMYFNNTWKTSPAAYTFEYSFRIADLLDKDGKAYDPKTRATIGFDITVIDRDNDAVARNRKVWANSDAPESWENMDGCAFIKLVDNLPPSAVPTVNVSKFSVYPNPATATITLPASANYEIYNVTGTMVMYVKNQNIIDISSLSNGVYFIKNKEVTAKFIKQ